ncbi:MAG: ParB N-terminal domain-containing protein [Ideonella sp.]|nr:ParB N-terminal domain-containing protein [Ideonella sp.]
MKPQIEHLPLDALVPYARNSRTHSPEQIAQVAASIREFGFTNPVLIDGEGGIIAGHGRVMAARQLGLSEVPCIRLAHLTDAQKRAYVIADNKLALNAGWDDALLALELREIDGLGFDLHLTGFNDKELDALLEKETGAGAAGTSAADEGIQYQEKYSILIECSGEADQRRKFDELTARGYACRVLVN